jgi:hypothetical protein
MVLGSGIRDPGSGKNLFRIPDPGSGSGSATLVLRLLFDLFFVSVLKVNDETSQRGMDPHQNVTVPQTHCLYPILYSVVYCTWTELA